MVKKFYVEKNALKQSLKNKLNKKLKMNKQKNPNNKENKNNKILENLKLMILKENIKTQKINWQLCKSY